MINTIITELNTTKITIYTSHRQTAEQCLDRNDNYSVAMVESGHVRLTMKPSTKCAVFLCSDYLTIKQEIIALIFSEY